MNRKNFLKMKAALHKMLEEEITFTRNNMKENGITDEQINEMQLLHIFGNDQKFEEGIWTHDENKTIFINWHSNRFYPEATLVNYDINCLSFKKRIDILFQEIEQLAKEEELPATEIADLIENHFQFGE